MKGIELLVRFLGKFSEIFMNAKKRLGVLIQIIIYAVLFALCAKGTIECLNKGDASIVIALFLGILAFVLGLYTIFSVIYVVLIIIATIIDLCKHCDIGLNIVNLFITLIAAVLIVGSVVYGFGDQLGLDAAWWGF